MDLQTMRRMAPHLQKFLLTCLEKNIQTAPDVAVPLCAFDEDFLKQYDSHFKIIRKCRPFVYIRADLSTQYCTAISKFTTPIVNNTDEVRNAIYSYREQDLRLKQQLSFPECVPCPDSLKQFCQGGCQTYKVYGTHQAQPVQFFPSQKAA
jgi:radical SAM protein with 4Fe4S-binding SPASM domain